MMRHGWLILCVLAAAGCDKSPAPPPRVSQARATAARDESPVPPAPTTQELMSGAYKTVSLSPLPLSAQVPESWDHQTFKGSSMSFLAGPAPGGGSVQISLEPSPPISPTDLDLMLAEAKSVAAKDKKNTPLCEVREVKGMKVLEMQNLLTSTTRPDQVNVDWKINYFVRQDVDYANYALVIYMPQSQFDQDKDLIRKIIDSVTYQAPANGL